MPVIAALAVLTAILMAVAYMRDRDFIVPKETAPGKKMQLPSMLLLIVLLLLTMLGVALIDAYQNNILLLFCVIAVAGVVGLVGFGRLIEPNIYPMAIFVIGLSHSVSNDADVALSHRQRHLYRVSLL